MVKIIKKVVRQKNNLSESIIVNNEVHIYPYLQIFHCLHGFVGNYCKQKLQAEHKTCWNKDMWPQFKLVVTCKCGLQHFPFINKIIRNKRIKKHSKTFFKVYFRWKMNVQDGYKLPSWMTFKLQMTPADITLLLKKIFQKKYIHNILLNICIYL